jgi:hypothetical protein
MSTLQKAVVTVFSEFVTAAPQAYETLFKTWEAPIYFATGLGELDSNANVAKDLYLKSLPVSPTHFQHSVHNCAPAYVTIVQGLPNIALTISAENLSLDKALYLAFHKIRNGIEKSVCILAGDELHPAVPDVATAQIILLTSELEGCGELVPQFKLASIESFEHDMESRNTENPHASSLNASRFAHLEVHTQSFERRIYSSSGEGMRSQWNKL